MRLTTRFNLVLLVVFMIGLGVAGYISYSVLHKHAREEVLEEVRLHMYAKEEELEKEVREKLSREVEPNPNPNPNPSPNPN